jgi:hypothetical protein
MTHDPRPHVRRRSIAVGRIVPITAGVAVAGIAGSAVFAAAAAATWSGAPDATPLADTTSGGHAATTGQIPTTPTGPTAPNGGFARPPTVTTPRAARGTGHASTGGSG